MRQEVARVHCWATDRDQVRSRVDALFTSSQPARQSLYRMSVSDSG
jgi:hypothetical protein